MSVTLNTISVIATNLGIDDNGKWHKEFANTCMKHMNRFVPKDSGTLRRSAHIEGTDIVYPGPYARYQYKGQRDDGTHVIKKWSEPGTGPYWDKRMVSADMRKIERDLERSIRWGK